MNKNFYKINVHFANNKFQQRNRYIKYSLTISIILIYFILKSYLYFNVNNKNTTSKKSQKNVAYNPFDDKYFIKLNTYNIYIDNIKDFFLYNIFILTSNKNNGHKLDKTFFFKPIYPNKPYEHIKFQEKNISLQLNDDIKILPTFFSIYKKGMREIFLKSLGFKLSNLINIHNLYIVPFRDERKFKKEIKNYIVDKSQKINRFINHEEYTSKSLLYINYKKFEEKYPLDYNYMLETYSYPEDKDKIIIKFKKYNLTNNSNFWMIKPKNLLCGKKISILSNFSNINLNEYIITKYLYNPHLIKGYKYDFRFHGLISGVKPLKIYLYNEGLVRIASEKYNFSLSILQNEYAFLTNLYVNQKNKNKFIYPQNLSNQEDSNLWNLETFQKYCSRNNINYNKLISEVSDIFIKTMLSVREKIIKVIEKNKFYHSNFYHLIGFDIILDENLKPYLLEMNKECGFRNNNDAEKYYTYNIVVDTLNIVGIKPKNLISFRKNQNKSYLLIENLLDNLEENIFELDRPRGGYKLIFPLKQNVQKYKKFYGENIPKEDEELWKKLIE